MIDTEACQESCPDLSFLQDWSQNQDYIPCLNCSTTCHEYDLQTIYVTNYAFMLVQAPTNISTISPITTTTITTTIAWTTTAITSTGFSIKMLPAIIIPLSLVIIFCVLFIYHRRRVIEKIERLHMGCCQKAEKDENVDDEYEIPYSFDEYETPYKFTTDSVTKL